MLKNHHFSWWNSHVVWSNPHLPCLKFLCFIVSSHFSRLKLTIFHPSNVPFLGVNLTHLASISSCNKARYSLELEGRKSPTFPPRRSRNTRGGPRMMGFSMSKLGFYGYIELVRWIYMIYIYIDVWWIYDDIVVIYDGDSELVRLVRCGFIHQRIAATAPYQQWYMEVSWNGGTAIVGSISPS